ncbi:MAG: hypothetical protein ABFS86_09635 [Planctomycetota bacterium]
MSIHAEALIFRSEARWLLAAVAWVTVLVAALSRRWDEDSPYHFALALLATVAWFAAFDRRPRVRSVLSALLLLAAVSTSALEGSQYLAGGLALPGLGLLTMTSLRM